MIYPEVLDKSIELLKKLPGIGERTAERIALAINDFSKDDVTELATSLIECKNELHPCHICGALTDKETCRICDNPLREKETICVVENFKDVFTFEKSEAFNGVYHVLNGLISPIDNIGPDDINIASLISRLNELEKGEVIIALRPCIEGDATTMYLKKILEKKNIKISRLPYGIPMGVEIDYLDGVTIDRAMKDRINIS